VALLIGEFEQTIDAKHRLAISSALREQIHPDEDGKQIILVLGPDRHLWLYPDLYYRRLVATLRRSPLPDRQTRRIDLLFAMARVLKPDAQGRVVLPLSACWITLRFGPRISGSVTSRRPCPATARFSTKPLIASGLRTHRD